MGDEYERNNGELCEDLRQLIVITSIKTQASEPAKDDPDANVRH